MTETTQDIDETRTTQPAPSDPLSSDPDRDAQPNDDSDEFAEEPETQDDSDEVIEAADPQEDTNI